MLFFLFFAAPRAEARSPDPHPPAEARGRAAPNETAQAPAPRFSSPPAAEGAKVGKGEGAGSPA